MDGLKQINDNYGHAAGDIAICACADILKKAAGEHGIAGRLGGDEFALMMIGDETRAIELMETVQKEIAMYNAQGKNKFVIDMSVGCQIVLCTDELSIPMVLEKADKIMAENGYMTRITQAILVDLQDEIGGLDKLLSVMGDSNVNLHYIYTFFHRGLKVPVAIMHCEDLLVAESVLRNNGFKVLNRLVNPDGAEEEK